VPIAQALADFKTELAQCDSLIANAHQTKIPGAYFLPSIDREQITVAAFLNMFIAWESFLETSLGHFMVGEQTINGGVPTRFVVPRTLAHASRMLIGTMKHFDYANHDNL
jgi:hypothetical protein